MGSVRGNSLSVFAIAFIATSALADEAAYQTNIIFQTKKPNTQQVQINDPNLTVGQFAGGSGTGGGGSSEGSSSGSSGTTHGGPYGLPPNQTLRAGQSVFSPNGRFQLTYQQDGNLVLYRVDNKRALWSSNTAGTTPGQATMQLDGNLAVFDASNTVVWQSRTTGHPGSQLSVQNDGNAVIYSRDNKQLWESDTVQPDGEGPGGRGSSGSHGSIGAGAGSGAGGGPQVRFSNQENIIRYLREVRDENPGMINDCKGHPIVTNFLVKAINALRKYDKRWGYFVKPDGRIPRDIIAYAYGAQTEGTHQVFIIDFISNGCGNTPGAPDFEVDQPKADIWFHVINPSGYADNGVWSSTP